jgi:hypothetical protein
VKSTWTKAKDTITKIIAPVATKSPTTARRPRDPWYSAQPHIDAVNEQAQRGRRWIPRRRGWLQ